MQETRSAWPWRRLLAGTATIGSLDLLFAWSFWANKGVTFTDILHSIASGWYGKASRDMGATSAAVGAASHYAIIFCFMLAWWLAARLVPALSRRWLAFGALYGLALYALMNFVVLPLSAAGSPGFDNRAWLVGSIAMHAAIGVLCAWFARKTA
ncbi:hypothetical protein GCM10027084_04900 [Pseudoxanthomonas sangjuensis]|uniref:hypothetical protein n=1 Tax=Pseudoxanthomonas sangjuensis TaxID=1503750 RepID=UPI0013911087|nr:hypothetical protein [Pseudoxanthomonas sangjuensis]